MTYSNVMYLFDIYFDGDFTSIHKLLFYKTPLEFYSDPVNKNFNIV